MHIKSETSTSSKSSSLTKGRVSNAFSASINILSLLFWRISCKWKRSALWKMTQAFCTSIASCIPQKSNWKNWQNYIAKKKKNTANGDVPNNCPTASGYTLDIPWLLCRYTFCWNCPPTSSRTGSSTPELGTCLRWHSLHKQFLEVRPQCPCTGTLRRSQRRSWRSPWSPPGQDPKKTKSSRAEMRSVLSPDICWSVDCHHPSGSDKNVTINH